MDHRYIPQEIQDNIIDLFIEGLPGDDEGVRKKPDVLDLRLVSRGWTSRVNFHVFYNLRLEIADCSTLLLLIKSSKSPISFCVRRISLHCDEARKYKTFLVHQVSEATVQRYLNALIEALPYIESLELKYLRPEYLTWVPCFSTIKNLTLTRLRICPSQLFKLVTSAASLENLKVDGCKVRNEEGIEVTALASLLYWETLKSYEARFPETNEERRVVDYHIFPLSPEPKLPSLFRLSLGRLPPVIMAIATRLLAAASHTLRFLQIWFWPHLREELHEQSLDLSCLEMLEFLRLPHLDILDEDELDTVVIILRSLPKNITNLTVSLLFLNSCGYIGESVQQIDSLLANKRGVVMVEMAPPSPEDREELLDAFPQLSLSGKLHVVKEWSEASQIFNTRMDEDADYTP